jgi:hypothetical protein
MGVDPLWPAIREELAETKRDLLALQEHLPWLKIEVALREALDEETAEVREWARNRVS